MKGKSDVFLLFKTFSKSTVVLRMKFTFFNEAWTRSLLTVDLLLELYSLSFNHPPTPPYPSPPPLPDQINFLYSASLFGPLLSLLPLGLCTCWFLCLKLLKLSSLPFCPPPKFSCQGISTNPLSPSSDVLPSGSLSYTTASSPNSLIHHSSQFR